MANWTMAVAKRDYERDLIKSIRIVSGEPATSTWAVEITSKVSIDGTGWLIDAKAKEIRQFKTIDAAVEAIRQIGNDVPFLTVEKGELK